MATYLIGYDLNKENTGYSKANRVLTDAIKSLFETWWHQLDSTWIVVTNLTAQQIRDTLMIHIDRNDELIVVKLSGEGAWAGFDPVGSNWLYSHL